MRLFTMGDFYVWYCDWCDSRNLTPWARTVSGKVNCGCCHKEHPVEERRSGHSGHAPVFQEAVTQ